MNGINNDTLRLDVLMAERGIVKTRSKAKDIIALGSVYVDGILANKAGIMVSRDALISLMDDDNARYVSRGGLKLEHAINRWGIDLSSLICADIGASTGGFTDCMLQNGAKKVYAIDVGTNQLDGSLRIDPRVVSIEQCNFRYFDRSIVEDSIDFVSVDVSFISLTLILPKVKELLLGSEGNGGGLAVVLVKPQFELGNYKGFKGVVKDDKLRQTAVDNVRQSAELLGFTVMGVTQSPVQDKGKNVELLMMIRL